MCKARRLIAVMLAFALVGLLAQVVSAAPKWGTDKPPREQRYYLVNYVAGAEVWGSVYDAFEDAAKQLGVRFIHKGPIEFDAAAQVQILNELLSIKPEGVIVATADPYSATDAINRLIDAGIPVITWNSDAPKSKRFTYVGMDNFSDGYKAGLFFGKRLVDKYGTKQTIEVGFSGIVGHYVVEEWRRGYKAAFAENFPNIKEVAYVDDKSQVDTAIAVQTAMLQAHPNIKGIIGIDGLAGPSAVRALRETGKKGVMVMATDVNRETLLEIKRGNIEGSLLSQANWTGPYYALYTIYWLVNNVVQVVDNWRQAGLSLLPMPSRIDTGVAIVTKDNVDLFSKLFK